jgi:hypothetical protein
MRTARENVSIFISHATLKRLLDEYENLDTASKLCADYCIDANNIALLIDEIPKPKRARLRLPFAVRSDNAIDIDEAYIMAR